MSEEKAAASNKTQTISIDHAGLLHDWRSIPGFVLPHGSDGKDQPHFHTCCFCGVGDSGRLEPKDGKAREDSVPPPRPGHGIFESYGEQTLKMAATLNDEGRIDILTAAPISPPGGNIQGNLTIDGKTSAINAREVERRFGDKGELVSQHFGLYQGTTKVTELVIRDPGPTAGCMKFNLSMMRQKPVFPIHVTPSVLDTGANERRAINYQLAISKLADAVLAHRNGKGRILIYACGQIDYFSIFAMQEVFRLLGVRNLTGNAEHCLNAGAVHNEILTGQEGPFLTVDQGLTGDNRFYLLNGWNGFITHPPAFRSIMKQGDFDGYLIEVMETESAKAITRKASEEHVLLIRPRTDPHLALAVAHQILKRFPDAVEQRFIDQFSEQESFARFMELARSDRFAPERVARRIAPEFQYEKRLLKGIQMIAYRITRPDSVPINIPSVGLSQTSGVVAHCLWGNVLAMIGKFGLNADGTPAGGTLRLPGQINAESEVQGLSRKYFMGRIPIKSAADAAARMGVPEEAYDAVAADIPRAALDYSDASEIPELFLFFGTHFEANMMGRQRWLDKLESKNTRTIVIDPFPDTYAIENAELIVPSPPHPATPKLYQNGEWKMSLSIPHKKHAPETRSDATIIYDLMAEISQRLESDRELARQHRDLAKLSQSGYLKKRFCEPLGDEEGLTRVDGEVSRSQLWDRIQTYMSGGSGPLYCRPEHDDGRPIEWTELLEKGSIIYGGVGTTRFKLDYDNPKAQPFADIFRQPRSFRFFVPTEEDLEFPDGVILNSGRSSLSDDRDLVRFATSTFNAGKSTPAVDMPDENPLHVSPSLARRLALNPGDWVRITEREDGETLELPILITDRVKGDTVYSSFHKSKGQLKHGRYINRVSHHKPRCSYCSQTRVKSAEVSLERVEPVRDVDHRVLPIDATTIDPKLDLPVWSGQSTPLYVTDIIQETHDVYTFRFQGNPLCRFVYWPGQFCTLILNIEGKKVVRSYTISSTPTRPFVLEVTIKRVPGGLVSNWLPDNLSIGDKVEISGPKGKFCLVPGKIPTKLLLLGAGSGVTPMMSMARWLFDVSANVDVCFFNSVRSNDDLVYQTEIDMLTHRARGFSPIVVTTTRSDQPSPSGLSGRLSTDMIKQIAPDLHERHVYTCGPDGFMDSVKQLLGELDFDQANLHSESFGGARTSVSGKSKPGRQTHAGSGCDVADHELGPKQGTLAIEFASSGTVASCDGSSTLLELAEANDVDIDYACRSGSCGECKCRLLKGEVESDSDDGLEPGDREEGYVLTCVARPKTNCTLDV
jgi:ferredoxin-NADP reductase/anaerobic selenocysteine-containing dehydrogenase